MFEMQKQSEIKARVARCTPTKEMVDEMMGEVKALGTAQIKQDGTMTFDFFLSVSKIINKYTHAMTSVGLKESVTKRRQLLKDEKME